MDHLLRSICKARAGLMPALVFLRRTVGRCGVCVAQTCTDTRSAHKTAHIGTTRPTPRSKRLRRCAFSDLCRSSAVNLPSGGGIGVRVLPASCLLVPKGDACARRRGLRCFATTFYAAHQKVISHPLRRSSFPKCKQFLGLHFGFLFSRYNSRYGILKFSFLPFVVATIVATQRSIPIPTAFWQDPRTHP